MKSKGHVYMANVMIACLKSAECQVTFPDNGEHGANEIAPYVKNCILRFPSCFRAGSVGPDFFPDLIFGQMTIHATRSGIWIDRMMDELKLLPVNSQEHQKAVSFFAGYMMHYAGDMFTHDYVNSYARGWFPSYGEVIQNLFSYDIDLDKAEKEYSELTQNLKKLLPTDAEKKKLRNASMDLWTSFEKLFAVEEEKRILGNHYRELREILGRMFSKETANKDLGVLSDEMRTFLDRLYANPFTDEQIDEELPKLELVLESFSGYQEMAKIKKKIPELGKALEEVFTFRTKRERLGEAYAQLLETIESSFTGEEKRDQMKKEFPELWGKIKELHKRYLFEKRSKGIEQAKIIIRHVLVEKYMDDYIDEQIEVAHRNEERMLEIPVDYIRRCFASEDAFRMVEKEKEQKEEQEQKEEKIISVLGYEIRPSKVGEIGFLENYMKYLSQIYEGEGTSDENLEECNNKINTWLRVWKDIAEYSLQIGTFKAFDLYGKELIYHFAAFFTEQEEKRRKLLDTMEGFDTLMGILDCDIPIISKIFNDIKEKVKDYLKRRYYPKILNPASYLSGKPKEQLTTFDKAVEAVKSKFKDVKVLLEDENLFGDGSKSDLSEEMIMFEISENPFQAIFGKSIRERQDQENTGVSKKLRDEWKNLGLTDQLKDIVFEPFQNACRMGYLCLMDPNQLNRLMQKYDPAFEHYKTVKTSIGFGGFVVSLKTDEKKYAKGISSIWFGMFGSSGLVMQFHVELTNRCFEKDGEIRIPLYAKRTIPINEVNQFELILNHTGPGMLIKNIEKLDKQILCSVYDGVTNLLLAQDTMTENYIDLAVEEAEIKAGYRDIARKAKIDHLRVEIETGNNGTQGTVHFVIVGVNGTKQDVKLDKSGYDDFESGDLDSYLIKLKVPMSIDEIRNFEIYKDGGWDWKMKYVKVFSLEGGNYLAGYEKEGYVDKTHIVIEKAARWQAQNTETTWHAPIQPVKEMVKEITITIKTAGETYSGTDDDIFFHIHYLSPAREEIDEEVELDTSLHDDFEKNDTDTFRHTFYSAVPVEDFLYFELKKKGKDDWVVEWVKVHDTATGRQLGAIEGRYELTEDEAAIRINVR